MFLDEMEFSKPNCETEVVVKPPGRRNLLSFLGFGREGTGDFHHQQAEGFCGIRI